MRQVLVHLHRGSASLVSQTLSFVPTDLCSDDLLECLRCCFIDFMQYFGGSAHDLTSVFSVVESW